ncbi:sialate O-acetylesterase [Cohnella sp.]|uniref:sialate O-acetylesterase n=1 Tax=Cohnella sp. TaxID=1883426 RepID=UPI003566D746
MARFGVNPIFTNHMVLQRDSIVPIWGTGTDGAIITVKYVGAEAEAVIAEGKWRVELPAQGAGGPYELTISSGGESIVLQDVLFGDVWLAGGQSNMEWRLNSLADTKADIAAASFPNVRFYDVPRIAYEGEEGKSSSDSSWEVCTPERASEFSAVAYYFAKDLVQALDAPIGIVGCNWGGTSASCWVPEKVLTDDPELKCYVDEYYAEITGKDPAEVEAAVKQYAYQVNEYIRKQALGLEGVELGDYPWPPPVSPRSFLRPNGLYETMLRKAAPYGLKGFIYYQGESDAFMATLYDRLLGTMIHTWRSDWGDPKLPFLFVQLPGFGCDGNPDGEEWALLRESQLIVTETVENTAMAVVLECGELNDIHPQNKKPVGERLALAALRSVYGLDMESSGPVYHRMELNSGKAIVHFDHVGEGLAARDDELTGFQIAGEDGVYVRAQAAIRGNSVEVWSEEVGAPVSVRYGWANFPDANLVNSFGLPAGPFRTNRVGRS